MKHIGEQFFPSDKFQLYYIKYRKDEMMQIVSYLYDVGISSLDIGFKMAEFISQEKSLKYLHIEAADFLNRIILESAQINEGLNIKVLAIYNCGILFEPSIGLDASAIIKGLSKKVAIITLWEGEVISGERLVWDQQNGDVGFNFKDMNIKEININYEV